MERYLVRPPHLFLWFMAYAACSPDRATHGARASATIDHTERHAPSAEEEPAAPRRFRAGVEVRTLVAGAPVELTHGRSSEFVFRVPDDALSVQLTVIGERSNYYWLCEWLSRTLSPAYSGWDREGLNSPVCSSCENRIMNKQ